MLMMAGVKRGFTSTARARAALDPSRSPENRSTRDLALYPSASLGLMAMARSAASSPARVSSSGLALIPNCSIWPWASAMPAQARA